MQQDALMLYNFLVQLTFKCIGSLFPTCFHFQPLISRGYCTVKYFNLLQKCMYVCIYLFKQAIQKSKCQGEEEELKQ